MRKADNLTTKSGSLNFLEPSGPVEACNGTALPYSSQRTDYNYVAACLQHCCFASGKPPVQISAPLPSCWCPLRLLPENENTPFPSQMKHQLDATLCRFYFCRITLHVSGASAHHQEYLKLVRRPLVHVLSLQVSHNISLLGPETCRVTLQKQNLHSVASSWCFI